MERIRQDKINLQIKQNIKRQLNKIQDNQSDLVVDNYSDVFNPAYCENDINDVYNHDQQINTLSNFVNDFDYVLSDDFKNCTDDRFDKHSLSQKFLPEEEFYDIFGKSLDKLIQRNYSLQPKSEFGKIQCKYINELLCAMISYYKSHHDDQATTQNLLHQKFKPYNYKQYYKNIALQQKFPYQIKIRMKLCFKFEVFNKNVIKNLKIQQRQEMCCQSLLLAFPRFGKPCMRHELVEYMEFILCFIEKVSLLKGLKKKSQYKSIEKIQIFAKKLFFDDQEQQFTKNTETIVQKFIEDFPIKSNALGDEENCDLKKRDSKLIGKLQSNQNQLFGSSKSTFESIRQSREGDMIGFEGFQFGNKRQRTSHQDIVQEPSNLEFKRIQINKPQVQLQNFTNDEQSLVHQPTSPQTQQLDSSSQNLANIRNIYDQIKIQQRKDKKLQTQRLLDLQKQQLLQMKQLHITQKDAFDQFFLDVQNKTHENFLKHLEQAKKGNQRQIEQIDHVSDYPIVNLDDLDELQEDNDMVDSRDGRNLDGSGQGADQQMHDKDVGNGQQLLSGSQGVGSQLASKSQGGREMDHIVTEAGQNQHVRTQEVVSLIGASDLNNTMNQEIKSSVVKDQIRQFKSKTQKQAKK